MEKIRPIAKKLLAELKRRWWYICLLISSTGYVWVYRFTIYQTPEITAQNIIFVLWLVLLAVPLFSEIEIGGVKLKREIEQTRSEVKESIGDLKNQIVELRVSNSSNIYNYNNIGGSLPAAADLAKSEKYVKIQEYSPQLGEMPVSDDAIFFFKVRYVIEKELASICERMGYSYNKMLIPGMVRFLETRGMLSTEISILIRQTSSITIRAMHGEIVDDRYKQFVRNTFPTILQALEDISRGVEEDYGGE